MTVATASPSAGAETRSCSSTIAQFFAPRLHDRCLAVAGAPAGRAARRRRRVDGPLHIPEPDHRHALRARHDRRRPDAAMGVVRAGDALEGRLVRSVALGKGIEYCVVDDASATHVLRRRGARRAVAAGRARDRSRAHRLSTWSRRAAASPKRSRASRSCRARTAAFLLSFPTCRRSASRSMRSDGTLRAASRSAPAAHRRGRRERRASRSPPRPASPGYPEGMLVDRRPGQRRRATATSSWSAGARRAMRSASPPAPRRIRAPPPPRPRARSCRRSRRRRSRPGAMPPTIRRSGSIRRDPAQSVVIGTDKNLGLYVYDLDGRLLQTLPDGRMNNVDLRDGFMVDGKPRTLVAASNRTDKTHCALLPRSRHPQARQRAGDAGADRPRRSVRPLHVSRARAALYVFVNDGEDGLFPPVAHHARRRKAVARAGARFRGRFAGRRLRRRRRDGRALHRGRGRRILQLLADAGRRPSAREIDRVDGPNGLKADIEGVALWRGQGRQAVPRPVEPGRRQLRRVPPRGRQRVRRASSTLSRMPRAASTACRRPTASTS